MEVLFHAKKSYFLCFGRRVTDEHNFVKWSEVERLVCPKIPKPDGIYLEFRQKRETKFKWLLRDRNFYPLSEYYTLSLPDREAFQQAVRAYIPVEEK